MVRGMLYKPIFSPGKENAGGVGGDVWYGIEHAGKMCVWYVHMTGVDWDVE